MLLNRGQNHRVPRSTRPPSSSSNIYQYSGLYFVLTVAMVPLLLGQLPGVLHPQPANQRHPEHAEKTLPGFRQHGGMQGHHLQRVSVPIKVTFSFIFVPCTERKKEQTGMTRISLRLHLVVGYYS